MENFAVFINSCIWKEIVSFSDHIVHSNTILAIGHQINDNYHLNMIMNRSSEILNPNFVFNFLS